MVLYYIIKSPKKELFKIGILHGKFYTLVIQLLAKGYFYTVMVYNNTTMIVEAFEDGEVGKERNRNIIGRLRIPGSHR